MTDNLMALMGPSVLEWARLSAALSQDEAAARIGVPTGTLAAWESGDERPTLAQLRAAGLVYHRRVGLFFLPAPPIDNDLGAN